MTTNTVTSTAIITVLRSPRAYVSLNLHGLWIVQRFFIRTYFSPGKVSGVDRSSQNLVSILAKTLEDDVLGAWKIFLVGQNAKFSGMECLKLCNLCNMNQFGPNWREFTAINLKTISNSTYSRELFSNVSTNKDSFKVNPEVLDRHPLLNDVRGRRQLEHPVLDRLAIWNIISSPTHMETLFHDNFKYLYLMIF